MNPALVRARRALAERLPRPLVRRLLGARGAVRSVRGRSPMSADGSPRRTLAPEWLPVRTFVRLAYNMVLRREPDREGAEHYAALLRAGTMTRNAFLEELRGSMEMRRDVFVPDLLVSLHHSRCDFTRMLPPAGRILDLGGTHQSSRNGALVEAGYPYRFEELVILDLPHEERHEIYRLSEVVDRVESPLGPVAYRYGSMADLAFAPDASFDLVYSGQTIEHVTEEDADKVLAEVARVLEPGGWFCVDTPNGPVCRLQQEGFINPDHEIEYSHQAFLSKLVANGFEVPVAVGMNHLGRCLDTGRFDDLEVARNGGLYWDIESCYLLAYMARKPVLPDGG